MLYTGIGRFPTIRQMSCAVIFTVLFEKTMDHQIYWAEGHHCCLNITHINTARYSNSTLTPEDPVTPEVKEEKQMIRKT